MSPVDYSSPPYPPDYLPIVTFDTSTHSLLCKRETSEEQLATIRAKRYVQVAGLAFEEMFSTENESLRRALLGVAARLTEGEHSNTLMPPHELIKTHILAHYENPRTYDWGQQDVSASSYHDELRNRAFVGDSEFSTEQREQHRDLQRQFQTNLTSLRSQYDEVFTEREVPRPRTFSESLRDMQSRPQRFDISLAKKLYDEVAGTNLSRYRLDEFISLCKPLRAFLNAHHMGRYDRALRDKHHGERFRAGRNDLYMAVYLPYCDEFVTDEKHGEQAKCLREVAALTGLPTAILTFDEFYEGLLRNKIKQM